MEIAFGHHLQPGFRQNGLCCLLSRSIAESGSEDMSPGHILSNQLLETVLDDAFQVELTACPEKRRLSSQTKTGVLKTLISSDLIAY